MMLGAEFNVQNWCVFSIVRSRPEPNGEWLISLRARAQRQDDEPTSRLDRARLRRAARPPSQRQDAIWLHGAESSSHPMEQQKH